MSLPESAMDSKPTMISDRDNENVILLKPDESESKNNSCNLIDQNSSDATFNKNNLEIIKVESELMSVGSNNILDQTESSTIIHIKESLKNNSIDEDVSLQEELDALSPLLIDNHTVLEHQELYIEEPEFIPSMKHSETKDSISSVDSDLCLSFDRRNSNESSSDDAKDFGCEIVKKTDETIDPPIEIPDDDLSEQIVEQVEYYFSNENILKDAFLLKHVRRNKEGFVSLKLVSSFKRVRQLTKDWRVCGYAIKLKSKNIELNDLETKIRRLEPLPNFDETTPSRTVVATDLPYDKISIEKVSDLFSKCGEIALVRILRPGGSIPADVRQFINKYPEFQQKECALVEFVESQSARKAQDMENMKVFEMIAPKKKTGKKSVTKMVDNFKITESESERSRGGNTIDYQNRLRRNSSGFFTKTEFNHYPRKISFNENYDNFHRRTSNCSMSSSDNSRKYSSCSDGYCSSSDHSRRPSNCSDVSRRTSNCSDAQSRRSSCSDYCPCSVSRRNSQCQENFRRISQCSEHTRPFVPSGSYERKFSNSSDIHRRVSVDSNYERKFSSGSIGGFENTRKLSFEPIRKTSSGEQFYVNRKISTDSGYDRRLSFGSDYSGPRSRSNSIYGHQENVVRTPIGPDGSKGFSRARKIGQYVPPV